MIFCVQIILVFVCEDFDDFHRHVGDALLRSAPPISSYLTSHHHDSEFISPSSSFEDFVEFPFFSKCILGLSGQSQKFPLCWRRHISLLCQIKEFRNFTSNIVKCCQSQHCHLHIFIIDFVMSKEVWLVGSPCRAMATS